MPYLSADGVVDSMFVEAVTRACGLERLRAGRHVLRDARGWKAGEVTVDRLWLTEIQPAFMDHACLAVLVTGRGRLGVFCVRQGSTTIPIGPIRGEWADPVGDVLQGFDAWSARRGISIDGIAYNLFLDTYDVQLAVNFVNPRAPALVALEQSFVQVAQILSRCDSTEVINEYLSNWMPYTFSPPALPASP